MLAILPKCFLINRTQFYTVFREKCENVLSQVTWIFSRALFKFQRQQVVRCCTLTIHRKAAHWLVLWLFLLHSLLWCFLRFLWTRISTEKHTVILWTTDFQITFSKVPTHFFNIRTVFTKCQLLDVYYARVESKLRYGICFWGNATGHRRSSVHRTNSTLDSWCLK